MCSFTGLVRSDLGLRKNARDRTRPKVFRKLFFGGRESEGNSGTVNVCTPALDKQPLY